MVLDSSCCPGWLLRQQGLHSRFCNLFLCRHLLYGEGRWPLFGHYCIYIWQADAWYFLARRRFKVSVLSLSSQAWLPVELVRRDSFCCLGCLPRPQSLPLRVGGLLLVTTSLMIGTPTSGTFQLDDGSVRQVFFAIFRADRTARSRCSSDSSLTRHLLLANAKRYANEPLLASVRQALTIYDLQKCFVVKEVTKKINIIVLLLFFFLFKIEPLHFLIYPLKI